MSITTSASRTSLRTARPVLLAVVLGLGAGLVGPGSSPSAKAAVLTANPGAGQAIRSAYRGGEPGGSATPAPRSATPASSASSAAVRGHLSTRPTIEQSGAGVDVSSAAGTATIKIRVRSEGAASVSQAAVTFVSAPFAATSTRALWIDLGGSIEMACDSGKDASMALAGVVGSTLVVGLVNAASGKVVDQFAYYPTYLVCSRATVKTVVGRGDISPVGALLPRTAAWLGSHGINARNEARRTVMPGDCPTPGLSGSYPGGSLRGLRAGARYKVVISLIVSVQVRRSGALASIEASIAGASWK